MCKDAELNLNDNVKDTGSNQDEKKVIENIERYKELDKDGKLEKEMISMKEMQKKAEIYNQLKQEVFNPSILAEIIVFDDVELFKLYLKKKGAQSLIAFYYGGYDFYAFLIINKSINILKYIKGHKLFKYIVNDNFIFQGKNYLHLIIERGAGYIFFETLIGIYPVHQKLFEKDDFGNIPIVLAIGRKRNDIIRFIKQRIAGN